ncbi:D-threitol dehydrogenase [Salinisphaera sp. USBA-960]|uniref:GolD/DthD family dehydrogenase n=1 Tax=Salinisphaera orenii TaxID=856731 RepID=UPI000DBE782F|nr:D-threitol dehydrogenase [Salifodinibacter halophilus]NNC26408.1 D-threitol dehydrogenase [Salifodinibacter halophilus]
MESVDAADTPEPSGERFDEQTVVITGAGRGIGFTTAQKFITRGAYVVLVDRDPDIVDTATQLGECALGVVADVSETDDAQSAMGTIHAQFGPVDILINNAGIGPLAPAAEYPMDQWDNTLDINLRGAFIWARACATDMLDRGSGRIINLASQAALVGIEGHVAYCASKAGIIGMTRCMALEWGPRGVTVNAVSPTVVETELGLSGWQGEKGARARERIPTGRFAQPAEIADAILFLASGQSAMVNGSNLTIDGGYTAV